MSNISGSHRVADAKKDLEMLLKQLSDVFRETPGRLHKSFKIHEIPFTTKLLKRSKISSRFILTCEISYSFCVIILYLLTIINN